MGDDFVTSTVISAGDISIHVPRMGDDVFGYVLIV